MDDRAAESGAPAAPPPAPAATLVAPPPPPPPPPAPAAPLPGQAFAAIGAQGRAVLSRLDPSGNRPAAIVGLVLLALVFGSLVINAAIPARGAPGAGNGPGPGPQPPPGGSVEFAGGVHVYPQPGWTYSMPAQDQLRLEKGAAVLDVFVDASVQGDSAAVLSWYLENVLRPSASQLAVSEVQVVPASGGATGVRQTYTGNFVGVQQPLEGQLTAVILGGRPLIFDAWGAQGQLAPALGDIGRMIDTTEVR